MDTEWLCQNRFLRRVVRDKTWSALPTLQTAQDGARTSVRLRGRRAHDADERAGFGDVGEDGADTGDDDEEGESSPGSLGDEGKGGGTIASNYSSG